MNAFFKFILVLCAAALVLGFAYLLTLMQPGAAYDPSTTSSYRSDGKEIELVVNAGKIEAAYLERVKLSEPTMADAENLEKALAFINEYILISHTTETQYFEKQKRLQGMIQDIRGKEDFEDLKALERKADAAFTSGEIFEALDLYRKLYEGWERAAKLYPYSRYFDINMLAKAKHMFEAVSVAPIAKELEDTQKSASAAAAEKNWEKAEGLYARAMELQNQINHDYPTSTFSNYAKVRELQGEIDSLKTAPIEDEIEDAIKNGKKYESEKDFVKAAEFYKIALDKQTKLNETYKQSRFASAERKATITTLLKTAQSQPLYQDIENGKKQLAALLLAGGTSKEIPLLAENLLAKCERFKFDFKQSTLLDDELILSLRYLGFLAKNIGVIQKKVYENLIAIAPDSNVKMLNKEIPQSLYTLIMQENPSRAQDPQKPVETVSYANALEFCRRLSWVLARKVELPKPSEFKEAIGSLKYADLNALSWNAGNSGLQTHHVATKDANMRGFYDLLGNVSEFTSPENSYSKPGIIGGNAQTWTDALSEIPFIETETSQRGDRMIGFRIVIRD